jgi:hypothetical protein
MARRKFDNVRLTTDGTMIRDVSSPRGTFEDTQVLSDSPNKRNKAWLYDILPGTTTGAAAERRKLNSKAISNVRKKVKGAEKSEKPARESLAARALLAGIRPGPLGIGPEQVKAQRALSQDVRRAEHPPEDRDAANAARRANDQVRRAEQPPEDRDAANAARRANGHVRRAEKPPEDRDAGNAARRANRRANAQVTISVRLHCALLLTTPVRLGVSHKPILITHLSFDGPRSFKKRSPELSPRAPVGQ